MLKIWAHSEWGEGKKDKSNKHMLSVYKLYKLMNAHGMCSEGLNLLITVQCHVSEIHIRTIENAEPVQTESAFQRRNGRAGLLALTTSDTTWEASRKPWPLTRAPLPLPLHTIQPCLVESQHPNSGLSAPSPVMAFLTGISFLPLSFPPFLLSFLFNFLICFFE